ncbi:MAG: DUF2971 domain-containing protein [Sedimentisphaerales bacterium]
MTKNGNNQLLREFSNEDIKNAVYNMFKFLRPVSDERIYHYTTLSAFKGILESRSLHLSHILCSNDYTEFENGIKFFWEDWLSSAKEKFSNLTSCIKNHESLKETLLNAHNKTNHSCFFSCCFGEKGNDKLNQWRVYAQDGFGVAIGFDTQVMLEICRLKGFFLGKCLYLKDDKIKACDTLAEQLQHDIKNKNFRDLLMIDTQIFSLFAKDECFEEEREARIATHPINISLDIKERNNRLVAFYALDIKEVMTNLIREVRIGPSHKSYEIRKMIEILLEKAGIVNCVIKESNIPYRSYKIQ